MDIRTFAFFDLETTGLPSHEFGTKITELCIVACATEHILQNTSDCQLPRVLHKLSICLNPFKRISTESTSITGLDNYLLEHENKFNENTVNLINNFLEQLQKPICLVAHNGNRFDFPLLRKHLDSLKLDLKDDTLLCIDSLEIFKKIDLVLNIDIKNQNIPIASSISQINKTINYIQNEQNDCLITNDLLQDDETHVKQSEQTDDRTPEESNRQQRHQNDDISYFDENYLIGSINDDKEIIRLIKDIKYSTDHKDCDDKTLNDKKMLLKEKLILEKTNWKEFNEKTPHKRKVNSNLSGNTSISSLITPLPSGTTSGEAQTPVKHSQSNNDTNNLETFKQPLEATKEKKTTFSKRELFPKVSTPKKKYTLSAIYERFYGNPPDTTHYAEADTIALLKCVIACKEHFIKFAEIHSCPFKKKNN